MSDSLLRGHLSASLAGGQAFDTPREIFDSIPDGLRFSTEVGERSPWQIVEHMRLTLEDIVAYSCNEDGAYVAPDWPDDYWPSGASGDWEGAVEGFFEALKKVEGLVSDIGRDLFAPFAWAEDHTLLREILLAIEHTAYHCGELVKIAMAKAA